MNVSQTLRSTSTSVKRTPSPGAVLELLKPITWFPPMWALMCGVVSSGIPMSGRILEIIAGVALAGPLVCGMSQAINDWCDRHVDAINEPERPIPSGRIPGRWGLYIAIGWTFVSVLVAAALGTWALGAAVVACALAWAYSAPPIRLKRNGWWGNSAVAICYEGVPWFTGAAIMAASAPSWQIVVCAVLYSVGAHGIMTLNDFKSIEGDTKMGVGSLPVLLGAEKAGRFACIVMAVPQIAVIALLYHWDAPWHAMAVAALLLIQCGLMVRLLAAPRERAPWYNATGVTLYVSGMLITAFALSSIATSIVGAG